MPDFELHSDFDRDGRLSGSQAERAARLRFPGAIVVPNLDLDRLPLADDASSLSPVPPDVAASLPGQDDELVRLEVRGAPSALVVGERLEIRVSGIMHVRTILQDRHGRLVPHAAGRPQAFTLTAPTSPITVFWLSVRTIAGARFDRVSPLATSFRVDPREERDFHLTVVRVLADGTERDEDRGVFSVAPVILDDRLAPVRRLYIVNKDEDNEPTRSDVAVAARAAGVPVVEVPAGLTGDDTWFQDQYQHGYMEGPNGFREIVLHLPRLRSDNSISTVTRNLGAVVEGHFRARNVALFNDLWRRVIVVQDARGRALRVSFTDLRSLVNDILQLGRVADHLNDVASSVLRPWQAIPTDDWIALRRGLRDHVKRLRRALDDKADDDPDDAIDSDLISGIQQMADALVRAAEGRIEIPHGRAGSNSLTVTLAGQAVTLKDDIARRLARRAEQMHSGANYGGNIEATPPVDRDAPLGKILVGNRRLEEDESESPDQREEFMDPDVLGLLVKQRKQPIVEIDTSWLKVGHVDEVVSVVPSGPERFAFLHASATAAMALMRRAEERHRAGRGLEPLTPASRVLPRGRDDRLMTDGTSPVTRLFRGKSWLQAHPAPSPGNLRDIVLPPRLYLAIAAIYGSRQFRRPLSSSRLPSQPGIGFVAQPGIRRYPADITPTEVLFADLDGTGASSNDAIDASVLAASRSTLSCAFPGVPIFPVPVLFDRIPSASAFTAGLDRRTTAFTPNMANMQVLNGHILVPRPHGPRMRSADAMTVVQAAMRDAAMPVGVRARVSLGLIGSQRLDRRYRVWVERFDGVTMYQRSGGIRTSLRGLRLSEDVVEAFRDSFPGASDTVLQRRIVTPNRHTIMRFGGVSFLRLVYGPSELTFDDGMVDLFELWMAAIAAELGVTLHFVDTWFYHLRDGQVHCGTNTLHDPPNGRRPRAYDVRDSLFRGKVLDFEAGETIQAGSK